MQVDSGDLKYNLSRINDNNINNSSIIKNNEYQNYNMRD